MIGAGPRGVCVLERILANASEPGEIVVHVVDPFVHKGGRVWSVEQPASLLMNTIASQVTLFTDDSVACAGPIVPGPSLYQWARSVRNRADEYPAHVRAEANALGPDDYPSRAFYGHYSRWALRRACRSKRAAVRLHEARAVALEDDADGSQVVTLDNGLRIEGLSAVVLALGHLDMPPDARERAFAEFAAERGLRYQPPANPAEVDLSGVGPGEPVALRGLGLTFFDYLALLGEGRGGGFERRGGKLVYRASGREPVLYAGSRRGVPHRARGENQKGVSGRHEPGLLTPGAIAAFQGRAADFRAEVWPLIAKEVQSVYYATLLGPDGRAFTKQYLACDPEREHEVFARFGIGESERWDWEKIAQPHGGRRFASPPEFRDWLLGHLRHDVAEAAKGNLDGAFTAALDVLRDIRNEIRQIVDHGGLGGDSYRDDLQAWYNPLNAYLSIGPPVRRIEEMIALIEAGVLRVLGPGMWARAGAGHDDFVVGSAAVARSVVRVTTLIEARLPEVDVRCTRDPLVRRLRISGQCAPYRLPERDGAVYETGGLAVTRRPYRLLDADGLPHPRRFSYGVPTETVHWVTAAGVRPGVDSVILGDADAIARAALSVPAVTSSAVWAGSVV
ncbi:FAD-NAD(P)-binding [Amycolatopsis xylanica]|uniref:FAD-NAD(P)-binding n=1 Tax=Amycolatopsis xylanica TaxID=589385 RepID=A0A1H3T9P2_9PSEU|nr:FAD-NAD(P)-binding [Amycolatopsis xylanica]